MNRSQFQIKGLNQEKAFNTLSKEVKVYKIKRKEHNLSTFEVDSKDEKKTKNILGSQGLEVSVLGHKGILKQIKNLLKSYGIIVGIIISLCLYIFQYNMIFKIEVRGSEGGIESEVKIFTSQILPSRFKQKINTKEVERKIKDNFQLVSSVSVAIVGQSLVINLNEAVLPPEMNDEFQPLVSEENGVVTKIELIQGTLNVKVGDVVKKGDILVYPYIIDTDGKERKVKPSAVIDADVWFEKEYCHKDYVVRTQRTGRKSNSCKVTLKGKTIYSHEEKRDFENFEVETNSQNLVDNNLIPFVLERTVYYELETVEITKPFEENKEEIIDLARENVLIFLQKNEIIKEEKYFVRQGGGCYFIDYIIYVSRNIGG